MAHGSKKWIVDYRGRIKRSRHRTKQDYQAGLPYTYDRREQWYRLPRLNAKPQCPQCRYVWKLFAPELTAQANTLARLRREYHERFEHPAGYDNGPAYGTSYGAWITAHPDFPGWSHCIEETSMMCYRCRDKERLARERWWGAGYPGRKAPFATEVRLQRGYYRAAVRHRMQQERYDDIPSYKRGWLD